MTLPPSVSEPLPVAALVVGYRPETAVLDALLLRLVAEVSLVVLLDNGGAQGYLKAHPEQRGKVQYLDMQGNQGLGAALNRGMEHVRQAGLRHAITFDQDSSPPVGMVAALYSAMQAQHAQGIPCAAIGPAFFDRRETGEHRFPIYREVNGHIQVMVPDPAQGLHEVDVLITSGMLVDTDAWADGLPYEDGLVVDYTDTDWCFRARAAGRRLFVLPSVGMPHALSDTPPVRVMGVHLLRYTPVRRYYYFRNTVYFVRRPYVSPAWRRRLLAGLLVRLGSNLFIDEQRLRGLSMSLKGLWHGLRGRLGRYPA